MVETTKVQKPKRISKVNNEDGSEFTLTARSTASPLKFNKANLPPLKTQKTMA